VSTRSSFTLFLSDKSFPSNPIFAIHSAKLNWVTQPPQENRCSQPLLIHIFSEDENNNTVKDIVRLYVKDNKDIESMQSAIRVKALPIGCRFYLTVWSFFERPFYGHFLWYSVDQLIILILVPLFFAISFVYSTVGFAGGSSYVAILILAGVSLYVVPPISLEKPSLLREKSTRISLSLFYMFDDKCIFHFLSKFHASKHNQKAYNLWSSNVHASLGE
jgi:hypothetical protein